MSLPQRTCLATVPNWPLNDGFSRNRSNDSLFRNAFPNVDKSIVFSGLPDANPSNARKTSNKAIECTDNLKQSQQKRRQSQTKPAKAYTVPNKASESVDSSKQSQRKRTQFQTKRANVRAAPHANPTSMPVQISLIRL